jgi:hypothetical protein
VWFAGNITFISPRPLAASELCAALIAPTGAGDGHGGAANRQKEAGAGETRPCSAALNGWRYFKRSADRVRLDQFAAELEQDAHALERSAVRYAFSLLRRRASKFSSSKCSSSNPLIRRLLATRKKQSNLPTADRFRGCGKA